jgi:formylglycine-generating enzyme
MDVVIDERGNWGQDGNNSGNGMKPIKLALLLAFTLALYSRAEEARFFRISGPVTTTITAFSADGTMVWTNAPTNTTFTVQTATSLLGESNWVDYVQIPITNSINTNRLIDFHPPAGMAFIPAGSFTMGDTLDGLYNALPTNVMVSEFYMDTNLVSYTQWTNVYAYATNHGYRFFTNTINGVYQAVGKAGNHPVHMVNWYDVVKWSNARSQQAGLAPVYYTDAGWTQVYTNGEPATLYPNWAASGYRLPTEAEWEKAARGGLSGKRFPWGDTISESQANYQSYWSGGVPYEFYDVNSYSGYNTNYNDGVMPYTSPVGSFAPNGYGLYDMAGNMFVWCWDWYGMPYGQPTATNPTGPETPEPGAFWRVLRGGAWCAWADGERCAYRNYYYPYAGDNGFRCVRRQ